MSMGMGELERRTSYRIAQARKEVSRCDLISDVWDSVTHFHRENADVKIRVGPVVGIINLIVNSCVVIYVIYTLLTVNVHMQEQEPMGLYSHWAGGGGAMDALGDEQFASGLCTYNASYDYLYGADNIWDYSAIGCEVKDVSYAAFKGTDSMHFITYEQRRRIATLTKTGASCDEECQTVYPEWPASASYGEQEWQAVHVETELFRSLKQQHPTLAEVPNVRMERPRSVGGKCRCTSFENIFIPGAEKMKVEFNFQVYSEYGGSSSKDTGADAPTSFFVTESGALIKTVPKGSLVSISAEEVLRAFGSCMDCQPDADFYTNALCPGGTCPDPYRPKPTPRVSGTVVDIRMEYYSHAVHMPSQPAYDEIRANHEPPYAIHKMSISPDWASRGSDRSVVSQSPERLVEVDNYRYGMLLRFQPAVGIVSRFSWATVLQTLVEFSVMMQWPGLLMGIIVFTALGHKSKLLRAAQRKVITLPELYRSFTYNAICAEEVFDKLDYNGNEFLSVKELKEVLDRFFMGQLRRSCPGQDQAFYDAKIQSYADLLMNYYSLEPQSIEGDGGKEGRVEMAKGISKQDFIDSVLANEPILWNDMLMKLENFDCDKGPVDRACMALAGCRRRRRRATHPEAPTSTPVEKHVGG